MSLISDNLVAVRAQMAAAARASGREPASVRLVAVSKTHGAKAVAEALAAGQKVFGENRVQEAAAKFPPLRAAWPGIELHLIGPLQTNKVAQAVALFDVIQTLDRPKLAEALAAEMQRQNRNPRLYLQVNMAAEPQKSGLLPEAVEGFLRQCWAEYGLRPEGLMCLPPFGEDPKQHFELLRDLAGRLDLPHLSMGMSGDFESAIAAGATEIRIGTAIFGGRP